VRRRARWWWHTPHDLLDNIDPATTARPRAIVFRFPGNGFLPDRRLLVLSLTAAMPTPQRRARSYAPRWARGGLGAPRPRHRPASRRGRPSCAANAAALAARAPMPPLRKPTNPTQASDASSPRPCARSTTPMANRFRHDPCADPPRLAVARRVARAGAPCTDFTRSLFYVGHSAYRKPRLPRRSLREPIVRIASSRLTSILRTRGTPPISDHATALFHSPRPWRRSARPRARPAKD